MGVTSMSENFVGAATVGERGQVVIPAEARERLGIRAGDKLLVFAHPAGWGVMFAKLEGLLEVQEDMARVISHMNEIVGQPDANLETAEGATDNAVR